MPAAARAVFRKIAPSAPHALHMPSHIFTLLGSLGGLDLRVKRVGGEAAH